MKSYFLTTLSALSAASIAGIGLLDSQIAQAGLIQYAFQVSIDSGNLAPNTYNGFLTLDDSLLSGIGSENLGVPDGLTVFFSFLGTDYTEADDPSASVDFLDGELLGLNFAVSGVTSFAFSPALPDVLPPQFSYSLINDAGGGTVEFSRVVVPEPSSLTGLGVLGILSLAALGKRRHWI